MFFSAKARERVGSQPELMKTPRRFEGFTFGAIRKEWACRTYPCSNSGGPSRCIRHADGHLKTGLQKVSKPFFPQHTSEGSNFSISSRPHFVPNSGYTIGNVFQFGS